MTRNLCAHPAQLLNPTISKFCHFSYMVITLHNSKILLFLHCFLTQQIQTFTNLLIGIFRLVIPLNFFLELGRNYVSIIVTIISNITVLQHYLLWIFVTIRRFLQLIVCIGVSNPPLKHQPLLFTKLPLKSANYPTPLFQAILPPQYIGFSCTPLKIGFFTELSQQ